MKIGEAAELTGLSISNIRFYEKKGLLEPARDQQSKYRDYSQEDIDRLKRILLYRKMDFSLETIHALLGGTLPLEEALAQQILLLQEKQEILQSSLELCEAIQGDSQAEPDVDYYLNYVKTEEAKGRRFAEIEELLMDYASQTARFGMLSSFPILDAFLRQNPDVSRGVMLLLAAVCLLLPVVFLIAASLDQNGLSGTELFVGLLVAVCLYGPLFQIYRKRRK